MNGITNVKSSNDWGKIEPLSLSDRDKRFVEIMKFWRLAIVVGIELAALMVWGDRLVD